MSADLADVAVGTELPALDLAAISRTTLGLFAGASGDHNPIHIDLDNARSAGFDDVFAHGMLSMAYLARLLTDWVPQQRIREYGVRFTAITPIHAQPTSPRRASGTGTTNAWCTLGCCASTISTSPGTTCSPPQR